MKMRVKIDDQMFEVEVGDLAARPILAVVDGETVEVWPEQAAAAEALPAPAAAAAAQPAPAAVPAARPAAPAASADRSRAVTAPIPGLIVGITVKEGQAVTPGQELLALEAMKMKNSIRATRAGTIARILVAVGDHVTQGQALVEFAE